MRLAGEPNHIRLYSCLVYMYEIEQAYSVYLQPLAIGSDFNNLINAVVAWKIKLVFRCHGRRNKSKYSQHWIQLTLRKGGRYRPPTKCRPVKNFTKGLGAVRLIKVVGMNRLPSPDERGPSSIFQDDGASTEVTGIVVSSRAWITAGKGSLTSPEKLKPARIVSKMRN